MKFYDVTVWQEPLSSYETVLVIAKNKKEAIKLANKECCVYKSHKDETFARAANKKYRKGIVIL